MAGNKNNCSSLKEKLIKNFLDGASRKTYLEVNDFSTKANISVNSNFYPVSRKSYRKRKEKSELKLTESVSRPEVSTQPVNESGSLFDKVSKSIKSTKDANTVLRPPENNSDFISSLNRKFDSDLASGEFAFKLKTDNTSSSGEKTFEGDKCKGKSLSRTSFIRLYKSHSAKNFIVCGDSQKVIAHEDQLERDKRILTIEKEFACNRWERRFKQKFNFTRHYRIHTNEKPFVCDICGKGYAEKNSLVIHERTHTGQKPYECYVCKKRFNHKSHLVTHHRLHTGEKPYECDVCKKRFSHSSNLTQHNRIHIDEGSFECDICKKAFKHKTHLTVHYRIHTNEKPYVCDICAMGFSQMNTLNNHRRTHTGDKPYKCDVCEKTYSRKSHLIKHNRMHTNEKAV